MTETAFFQDLAILMVAAGASSAIFARFNWPKVMGYILAGALLSEHTWGGSFLISLENVQIVGQLGVVFLMLSMGLEFSTREFNRVKKVTFPTALIDTILMMWLGYTVGTKVFGWPMVASLFLGAAICDSATTMLAKIIDEIGWRSKRFVGFTLGTSVCEDIITVGIIALITGIAHGSGADFGTVASSMGGMFVFFVLVLGFGLAFVPRFLTSIAKRYDDEVLLLVLLGLTFLVSFIAYKFQFSLALGAFLVGILGASSTVRVRLNALILPLKSMFAAVFFVSIGALVDPVAWLHNWPYILVLILCVMGGKLINVTLGGILTGESVKTSVQMGMSLAQIGEFAFMVALLYVGATGDQASPMYQVVVAVSIITTLLNPLMLKYSDKTGAWVESHLPGWLVACIQNYSDYLHRAEDAHSDKATHIRAQSAGIVLIAVFNFGIAILAGILDDYDWSRFSVFFERHDRFFFTLCVNVFVVGMIAPAVKIGQYLGVDIAKLTKSRSLAIVYVTQVLVFVALFIELTMINLTLAPANAAELGILTIVVLLTAAFGWQHFTHLGKRAWIRIDESLSADDHIAKSIDLTIPASSPAVGETVVTLNVRAKTGVLVSGISTKHVFAAGDTISVVGTSAQIASLKDLLGIIA